MIKTIWQEVTTILRVPEPRALGVHCHPNLFSPPVENLQTVRGDAKGHGNPYVVHAIVVWSEAVRGIEDISGNRDFSRCCAATSSGIDNGLSNLKKSAITIRVGAKAIARRSAISEIIETVDPI